MAEKIRFAGLTADELLALPQEDVDALVLTGQPAVFSAGSAQVLGSFTIVDQTLRIELAQIDGGGEGVLIAIGALGRRFAKQRGLSGIEWIVHAVACAHPNLRLRRLLEQRGFVVRDLPTIGQVYYLNDAISA